VANVLYNIPIVVFKGIVEIEKDSDDGEKHREGNQCGMGGPDDMLPFAWISLENTA
jgi:hypothetical protein